MDHAVAVERHIPGAEQRLGDAVAFLLRRILGQTLHQRPAVEPGHRQQAPRAVARDRHRHMHRRIVRQHQVVKAHLRRLALVIEFLAQAFGQFLVDLLVLDGVVHAVIDRHRQTQLAKIGFDRARHVGILQLAGDVGAVVQRARDAPGRDWPRRRLRGRSWRTSTASRGRVRSPCDGARSSSPSAGRWPATARVPRRIPPAARRARWTGTAPPSSAGPSGRPGWCAGPRHARRGRS